MKVEFSAFPKAFSGNVAAFVAADKQLLATRTIHQHRRRRDRRAGDRRQPLHRRQGPVADGAGAGRQHRAPHAARCRQEPRARRPGRRGAGRHPRGRGQCGGPEGGDRRRRSGEGQQAHARPDRRPHRARRAAAQLPLRQVQDQGQARAEELARADHRLRRRPGRGAPRLRAARAHRRRGVLRPRPGERARQRPLSRGVRPPRPRAHQARRQESRSWARPR